MTGGLRPGESIHQARISLYPVAEGGATTWTYSTVRYTAGGRVPQIITQDSGMILCPPNMSEWGCAEALYSALREILGK